MSLRETCLWEHLTPGRPDRAALKGEVKVDVCVIGAGITGLSAAIHLLEQGKSVAVLEAHRTGHGGSGRNVGLVNAGLWIPPVSARRWAASSTACWARHRRWCSA
jgi:glycine/D-amino acid oxidase-like deaminating enzyme